MNASGYQSTFGLPADYLVQIAVYLVMSATATRLYPAIL
jgi:hypothetical protein